MLVAGKVVHDNDLAAMERGKKNLFDINQERLAVDGPFQCKRGLYAIESNCREHRGRLPMSNRSLAQQTLSSRTPAIQTYHVRLGPTFIDKTKAGRIDLARAKFPVLACLPYVGSVLLGGPERLFLKGNFSRSNVRWTVT